MTNRFTHFISAVLTGVAFAAPTPIPADKRVTLQDAKKYAVENNFEIQALRKEVEETTAGLRRTHSAFYPKFGIAAGLDTQNGGSQGRTVEVGYGYLKYNVFNGFQDLYRSDAAGAKAKRAEIKLDKASFRIGLEVEKAFHYYLYKKGALALKKNGIELNAKHMQMAKQRRASGLTADSDVMEFDIREAILKSDMLVLEQELVQARADLKRLLGEEIGGVIEPAGALQHQHIVGSLNDYASKIGENSEAVLLASQDAAEASAESKLERGGWYPSVDIGAHAGYLPLDLQQVGTGALVGGQIIAKWDLFSGFETMWANREAIAKRERSEAALKNALLRAVNSADVAYREIKSLQARVDLEEENAVRADKYYRSVVSEYRRGVKNSADVRVAAEMLYDAHLRREQYKFEFLSDRIDLEIALGVPVKTETEKDEHEHHDGKIEGNQKR
jgi:outer membrane protein TolC